MAKDCSTCKKYCYEYGLEDNDEYCHDGIDLNTIPEDVDNFECPHYKEGKADIRRWSWLFFVLKI